MKKTIIGALIISSILSASAMDTLEVTNISYVNGSSQVTYKRSSDDREMFTMIKSFIGSLTAQEAVNKGSYLSDSYVLSTTNLAPITAKYGQSDTFAQMRSDAYATKGLIGYFVELARQNNLLN